MTTTDASITVHTAAGVKKKDVNLRKRRHPTDTGRRKTYTSKPKIKPTKVTEIGLFKPYIIPQDFCLVIDTREQRPLFTSPPKGLLIIRDTLHNGDYSIRGFEDVVAVERKGISDLISYMTSERERTKVKLERLRHYLLKLLVIESSWDDLFMPKFYTSVSNEVIRQSLVSFQVKFGLHIFADGNRENVERYVLDRLIYFYKQARK